MKYNMIDVGQRIKEERLKNGYKRQDDLCDELHIGRNTLSAWENGKANIELGDLIKLCELFNCEVGYLLCEYDTPYRVQSDISEQTQLSTKAIENIMKSRDNHKKLFGNYLIKKSPLFRGFNNDIYFREASSQLFRPILLQSIGILSTMFILT